MSSVRGDVNTRMSVDITVTCTTLVSLTFNQMLLLLLLLLLLIFSANPRHASIHVSHDGAMYCIITLPGRTEWFNKEGGTV